MPTLTRRQHPLRTGPRLSTSDQQLLRLIAAGLENPQIAKVCGWTPHEVKVRLRRLYRLLGVDRRIGAVVAGFALAILDPATIADVSAAARSRGGAGPSLRAGGAARASQAVRRAPVSSDLSASRTQVLQLLAEGLNNSQIAARLSLSLDQVKYRLAWWYDTSGTGSRTALVAWGRRTGAIERPGAWR
ncbi:LuxR C-terminal-related transcriptional regulator [Streptacidiphilus sp. PAMC 29251]